MPHLLTEAASWLGYAGFRVHLTCKELYEQRDEGPRMMRLELRESEVSPSLALPVDILQRSNALQPIATISQAGLKPGSDRSSTLHDCASDGIAGICELSIP